MTEQPDQIPVLHRRASEWYEQNGSMPEPIGGFYRGHAKPEARSLMNIPFRLPSEELEDTFAKDAKKNNLIGLKGSLRRRDARFALQRDDR
jgi:hypothetical protein